MSTRTEDRTAWLNRLLRGELSAVETYEQAMSRCQGEACAADLRHMLEQHRESADLLRRHVIDHGEEPSTTSGAWGSLVQLVTGAAKVFGTATTFQALKEGEEHGVTEYESALADESLARDCRELIDTTLLPRTRAHVKRLEALINAQ